MNRCLPYFFLTYVLVDFLELEADVICLNSEQLHAETRRPEPQRLLYIFVNL